MDQRSTGLPHASLLPCQQTTTSSCSVTASSSSSGGHSQGFNNSPQTPSSPLLLGNCRNNNLTDSSSSSSSSGNNLTNIPLPLAQRSMQFVQHKNETFRRDSMKNTITKQRKTKDVYSSGNASVVASELKNRLTSTPSQASSKSLSSPPSEKNTINILNCEYRSPFTLFQLNEDYRSRLITKKTVSPVIDFLKNIEHCCGHDDSSMVDEFCSKDLIDSAFMNMCTTTQHSNTSNQPFHNSLVNYNANSKQATKRKVADPTMSPSGIILREEDEDCSFPVSKLKRMMKNHEEDQENKDRKLSPKEEKDKKLYLSIEQSLPAMIDVFTLDQHHLLDSSIVFSIQNICERDSFVIDTKFNIPSVSRGEKFILNVQNRHMKPVRFCIMFRDTSGTHVSVYPKKLKLLQSLESDLEYLPSKEHVSHVFDSSQLPTICDKKESCKVSLILMATTHVKFKNAIAEICSRIQGVEKNPNLLKASIMDRDTHHNHPLLESSSSFKRVSLKSIDLMIRIN